MKTLFATILVMVVVSTSYCQKTPSTTKATQHIERKADSVNTALNTSFKAYQAKVDSLNKEKLIEALKNSNELQNGNNTYYSVPIAAVTLIVTAFAIVIGINAFSVAATYRKEMREQRQTTTKLLQEQKDESFAELRTQAELFDKVMENQEKTFNTLVEQVKNSNANWTTEAQNRLNNLDERLKAIKDGGDTLEVLKKELESVKNSVTKVKFKDAPPPLPDLGSTGITNYLDSHSQRYKGKSIFGKLMKSRPIQCPHCKQYFNPLGARKTINDSISTTYTCPNPYCGKGIEVRDHTT